jgi:hypothetical protein
MRKSRHTEEQIIGILAEQENGRKVSDICQNFTAPSSRIHSLTV